MNEARVLVIDDSAAMRALFCDILEQTPKVTVVGRRLVSKSPTSWRLTSDWPKFPAFGC